MGETLVVLQARMGSTRLPGKVLSRLGDHSILSHCVRRLLASGAGEVVVATTTAPADDAVACEARRLGVAVTRGPDADVLARFVEALSGREPSVIIRATADNPAVDVDAPARMCALLRSTGADCVVESDLPYGSAVEGVRTRALREAHRRATAPSDREHVTPFIRRHRGRFSSLVLAAPRALRRPDLRFTVDTPGDLVYLRRLFRTAEHRVDPIPLVALVAAADRIARVAEVACVE